MSHSRLPILKLTAFLALVSAGAEAQTGRNLSINVSASRSDGIFWVDGTQYKGSAHFTWPQGSKHVLEIRDPQQFKTGWQDTRVTFAGWQDQSGKTIQAGLPVIVIGTDPEITSYIAQFVTEHKLDIWINDEQVVPNLGPCRERLDENSPEPPPPSRYGFLLGTNISCGCVTASTTMWVSEGTQITLNAVPYPGYAFVRYREEPSEGEGPFRRMTMTGPKRVRVYFDAARRYTFETAPVRGLKVLIDQAEMATRVVTGDCLPSPGGSAYPPYSGVGVPWQDVYPICTVVPLCTGDRDLLPGNRHVFGAPDFQTDPTGKHWVFDHWEYGTQDRPGNNHVHTVPRDFQPWTWTAHFVPGIQATFKTVPNGLTLKIDNRTDWKITNFFWGMGHKHTVSAPLEQTDAQGRRYVFKRWSNGGPADQEVAIDSSHTPYGLVMTAEYELLGQLSINGDLAGVKVMVGDTECRTPCVLDRSAGLETTISVLPEEYLGEDTLVRFRSWWDGDENPVRKFTFTGGAQVLNANFSVLHRLRLISDPEEGVDFAVNPITPDGLWFVKGQEVQISAEPRTGFKFRRWDGVLSGTVPQGTVLMMSPATVVAKLDRIPALKEGAVRNAASLEPGEGVAPGSLIAIEGMNMAGYFEQGPTFPLKQALQGIFVQVGDRILPLLSVAPDVIYGLLPSDMKLGETKLVVRTPGQPDLEASFQVIRNAPGIFSTERDGDVVVDAYHEDGKPVTVKDPARRGETIRISGTGFGPLNPLPPDGFPVPDQPAYVLRDPGEIALDDRLFPVESITAAPGTHGKVWIRLKITDDMPAQAIGRLSVLVNGKVSNSVDLPLN